MNPRFVRLIAFFLVPCLLADPLSAMAHANRFSEESFSPRSGFFPRSSEHLNKQPTVAVAGMAMGLTPAAEAIGQGIESVSRIGVLGLIFVAIPMAALPLVAWRLNRRQASRFDLALAGLALFYPVFGLIPGLPWSGSLNSGS